MHLWGCSLIGRAVVKCDACKFDSYHPHFMGNLAHHNFYYMKTKLVRNRGRLFVPHKNKYSPLNHNDIRELEAVGFRFSI